MAFLFSPGCCCSGCLVFADDFNRADSGTVGNDWVEDAGAWSILSNALRISAASAVLSRDIANTQASDTIAFRFKASADGDQIRFYPEYVSGFPGLDDFWEITVGTGATIELFINNADVFICDITAAVDTWHTLRIVRCAGAPLSTQPVMPGMWVYLNDEFVLYLASPQQYSPGTRVVAFGTGGTVTGNIDFDDFSFDDNSGLSERQSITISGTPTGGTFTLTFSGQTTGSINYNASAANVVTALQALLNIETWEVGATGGSLPGTPVVVIFGGRYLCGNVPQMTATSSLTGGTDPEITIETTVDSTDCPQCSTCPLPFMSDAEEITMVITNAAPDDCTTPGACEEFESCGSCGGYNGTYVLQREEAACEAEGSNADYIPCQCGCFSLAVNIEVSECSGGTLTTDTITEIRVLFVYDATNFPSAPRRLVVQLTSTTHGFIEATNTAIGTTTTACNGTTLTGSITAGPVCAYDFSIEA